MHFLSGGPSGPSAKALYANKTAVMSNKLFHRPISRPTLATGERPGTPRVRKAVATRALGAARARGASRRPHSPAAPAAAVEGSPAPSTLTPPAALANAALPAAAGPSCCAERGVSTASGRRPDPSVPPRAQRPRGRRAASLRSPRRCGPPRPRRRDPSRGACSQPRPPARSRLLGPTQRAGMPRAPEPRSAGPSAGGPYAALPQSPLPRRRPGTPAHARGQPPELEMPPRLRPPPSPPVPLPHVGRAATAAATTISDPLPLPLSLTDSSPRRPSPACSAHARHAHAAATGLEHARGARAGLAGLQGRSGRALRLRPSPWAARLPAALWEYWGGRGWLGRLGPAGGSPLPEVRSLHPLGENLRCLLSNSWGTTLRICLPYPSAHLFYK